MCAPQKDINVAAIDMKRVKKPKKSILGTFLAKCPVSCLELAMVRNTMTKVTEKERAMSDETPKIVIPSWFSSLGLSFSVTPPGIAVDVAKVTDAMIPARPEHWLEMSLSHFLHVSTSFACVCSNTSFGVIFSLLEPPKIYSGTDFFTVWNQHKHSV